jgi:HEAT repeat protein
MAVSSLCNALLTDPDAAVRCNAAEALGKIGDENAIPSLTKALSDNNGEVRQRVAKALGKIGGNSPVSGDRIINTDGGNYYESIDTSGGNYIQGDYINMDQNLSKAATEIQDLIEQLQRQGVATVNAQEHVAQGMATQAQDNPTMRDKLAKWGRSLIDATVSDVVKEVVKLAIRLAGIPLP